MVYKSQFSDVLVLQETLTYISDTGFVGPMKRRTTNTYIVEYNISYKYFVYNILYIMYNINECIGHII